MKGSQVNHVLCFQAVLNEYATQDNVAYFFYTSCLQVLILKATYD